MTKPFLKIIPLGGLGEVGLNCQLWETNEGIVIVDCGILFPNDLHLGIDLILPPLDYIASVKKDILGVVLTHGHEDHIGAIPWLVPLANNLSFYGSPFTIALVEHKLKERKLSNEARLIPVTNKTPIMLGSLHFQFIPVSHSIPQGYALAVTSPVGKVFHSGDFKIDTSPHGGVDTDIEAIKTFAGKEGVRLLLSDSTNAGLSGHSGAELSVQECLYDIFSKATGRIIVTLFASHIERIQTICNIAQTLEKAVIISGRSLMTNTEKAQELGFLTPPSEFFTAKKAPPLPAERTVIIATGSQGEPLSALARIASGEYPNITIQPGDTIIMSSRVIPGNNLAVNRLINQMYRLGANVHLGETKPIHVSGHAKQDELLTLFNITNPKYFVPIHGEYRQLAQHKELILAQGFPEEHIFILENGRPLMLLEKSAYKETKFPITKLLVDGKGIGEMDSIVLQERKTLSNYGVVVISLTRDQKSGITTKGPFLRSSGAVFEQEHSQILKKATLLITELLATTSSLNNSKLEKKIETIACNFFRKMLGREPLIITVITDK